MTEESHKLTGFANGNQAQARKKQFNTSKFLTARLVLGFKSGETHVMPVMPQMVPVLRPLAMSREPDQQPFQGLQSYTTPPSRTPSTKVAHNHTGE